jgi:hypothetical protein
MSIKPLRLARPLPMNRGHIFKYQYSIGRGMLNTHKSEGAIWISGPGENGIMNTILLKRGGLAALFFRLN